MSRPLILASGSPYRLQLLKEAGYEVTPVPADIVEPELVVAPDLEERLLSLAVAKAQAVADRGFTGLILAADTAVFGQPEINLATIPGAGGTQRLIRAIGKAKAMELVLTGRTMDAAEAERSGLVARVVPAAELLAEALKVGAAIAAKSRPIVAMAKDAVNAAYEATLSEGLRIERRQFYATFATADRLEGMRAFVAKRQAEFTNR